MILYSVTDAQVAEFARAHRDWIGKQDQNVLVRTASRPICRAEEIRHDKEALRPVLLHRVAYYAEQKTKIEKVATAILLALDGGLR